MAEVLANIMKSPRGVLYVTMALSSFAALIYIFLSKKCSTSSKRNPKRSGQKSPSSSKVSVRQASSPTATKSTPKKDSLKQKQKSATSESKSAKPEQKKIKDSPTKQVASGKANQTAKKSEAGRKKITSTSSSNIVGKQNSQEDDGEWKVVTKKKTKVTKRQPDTTAQLPTRSSGRRINQPLKLKTSM